MPVFNLTIDDTSPLIQYDPAGGWSDSSHADDYWSAYSNGTFHATDQLGAKATLTFNGSAVYLYGAFRPNHDIYWTTLDGSTSIRNGNPNSTENLFQRLMYSAEDLSSEQHQLIVENKYNTSGPSWVDVDYVLVTSGDGILSWDDSPNDFITSYYNNTMHRTSQTSATATISFEGNAITVYGATSTNHAAFSVALDGGVPIVLNGSAPVPRFQNMLLHTLTMSNVDTTGMWFDLDKVVVSKWGEWNISGATSQYVLVNLGSVQLTSAVAPIVIGVVVGVMGCLIVLEDAGVDRIHTGATTKEDIFDGPEGTVDPFNAFHYTGVPNTATTAYASSIDFSERTPLDLSQSGHTPTESWIFVQKRLIINIPRRHHLLPPHLRRKLASILILILECS
ncbi:hypothetical protein BC629DRAFT_1723730 [Irpex lacteus]|nr:hypothetical protein BC629DRAFT_1723730 [Irpex lacteus]